MLFESFSILCVYNNSRISFFISITFRFADYRMTNNLCC
nr:MAG TPA: hypothetical protein [Caudoviricetes sp.]